MVVATGRQLVTGQLLLFQILINIKYTSHRRNRYMGPVGRVASNFAMEIMGTKGIQSPPTFATIFVIFLLGTVVS